MRTSFKLFAAVVVMQSGLALGASVMSEDVAVQVASKTTAVYKLTTIPSGCLYFDIHDEGRTWLIRIR